jgi:hypothetical protein
MKMTSSAIFPISYIDRYRDAVRVSQFEPTAARDLGDHLRHWPGWLDVERISTASCALSSCADFCRGCTSFIIIRRRTFWHAGLGKRERRDPGRRRA